MSVLIMILFLRPYLYQLHHSNWVEEVKATESVLPVGGAGDVTDRQRGCVTGKDGVPKERNQHVSQTSVDKAEIRLLLPLTRPCSTYLTYLICNMVTTRKASNVWACCVLVSIM